jgi:hypothetical protein
MTLTHEPIEGEHFIVVSESTGDEWEIVVGLEVHCELATVTKLFCAQHECVSGVSRPSWFIAGAERKRC